MISLLSKLSKFLIQSQEEVFKQVNFINLPSG